MELATVSCNKCGAALQVADTAHFVTCRYCGAQLEVKRTDSTISTEVLNRIDQRTADMADDLEAIRRDNEIERLDREWTLRRGSLMVRTKRGNTVTPTVVGGIVTLLVGGGFGLFWTIMAFTITSGASHMGAPGVVSVFPIFGIVFIVFGIVMGVKTIASAQTYDREEQEYQQRRSELLARSNQHEKSNV